MPERRERYEIVSEYLNRHRPGSLVGFSYQEEGIRCARDGRWYPLVLMDWVEGPNLFEWLRERCQQRDSEGLACQADQWAQVVDELVRTDIAHGDLQHGNVLVSEDGEIKLVDYDCLHVPQLNGRVNLEVGIPPYQHPARDENTISGVELQRFSALFVYVVLRVLAMWPDLWDEHVTQRRYDKLLFRGSDFTAPEESHLCRQLTNCGDAEIRFLVDTLLQAYRRGMAEVPPLHDVVEDMAAPLDPYFDWLGIRTESGELTYYDLLGVDRSETSPHVIRSAAERRLEQVVSFVTASSRGFAQRLIREINAAQLALLDPGFRRRYDDQLNTQGGNGRGGVTRGSAQTGNSGERTICPSCHAALTVPRGMQHGSLRCPSCGHLFSCPKAWS